MASAPRTSKQPSVQTAYKRLPDQAKTLLIGLSWFAPEPIPISIWEVVLKGEDPGKAFAALEKKGFVVKESDDSFTIPDEVRDLSKADRDKASLEQAVAWLKDAFSGDPQDPDSLPSVARWKAHAVAAMQSAEENRAPLVAVALAKPLSLLYVAQNQHDLAEATARKALALIEKKHRGKGPEVARALYTLGERLWMIGKNAEAEDFLHRALMIDEAKYGKSHTVVAEDLSLLGAVLYMLNRRSEAEPLMRRALAIDEYCLGPQHVEVMWDLYWLGNLLAYTDRNEQAETVLRRALRIADEQTGLANTYLACLLSTYVPVLYKLKKYVEAEPMARRLLGLHRLLHGNEDVIVADDLTQLGFVLICLKRFEEAEPLLRRAVTIYSKSDLPPSEKEAWIKESTSNYGYLLDDLGYSKSEKAATLAKLQTAASAP